MILITPNILWLNGLAGSGKSAIASSVVSRLSELGRLGSSFFFRRGDIKLCDASALWRTVAFDLAQANSTFAYHLVEVLKEKRIDPERDITTHFRVLIEEPLTKSHIHSTPHTIPIVLIDALDECDPARKQALLHTLMQWLLLPKKFKLIITGSRRAHARVTPCSLQANQAPHWQ